MSSSNIWWGASLEHKRSVSGFSLSHTHLLVKFGDRNVFCATLCTSLQHIHRNTKFTLLLLCLIHKVSLAARHMGSDLTQRWSLGKIQSCSVRFGRFWAQKDFTLSAVGMLSVLLWDHVAVWLNWSHLIPSMFVFRLQLPLVTTAGLCCCQEHEGSPKVHTVLGRALNLFASSFHPLIQDVNRDGWSSTYIVYLLLSISESATASKL